MSVIALSSCAAAPFAQRPTSAANRYVLIVNCCASLALKQARLLSLWQELPRSIDALADVSNRSAYKFLWFVIAHNGVGQPGTHKLHMQPGRGRPARVLPPQVRAPQGTPQCAWTTLSVRCAANGRGDGFDES